MGCKDGTDEAIDWCFRVSGEGVDRACEEWVAAIRAVSTSAAEAAEKFGAYCEAIAAMARSGEWMRCEACGYLICDCEAVK